MSFIDKLCGPTGFMPHGHCYLWNQDLLTLHLVSDALITLAYFSIPFTLLYFIRALADEIKQCEGNREVGQRDQRIGDQVQGEQILVPEVTMPVRHEPGRATKLVDKTHGAMTVAERFRADSGGLVWRCQRPVML